MLRRAGHHDVKWIQVVLNAPENLKKLEGYSNERLVSATNDPCDAIFVWEEAGLWAGFCWLRKTQDGTKIEEFGVSRPGHGLGSRFFAAVLAHIETAHFPSPIHLRVAGDNTEAIRFYERFGFTKSALEKSVWKRREGPVADALTIVRTKGPTPSDASGDQYMT